MGWLFAAFCTLCIGLVVYMYRIGYIPPVRTGTSEIIDFYIQGWNLAKTPSWRLFFLTDYGINDPNSLQNSIVYTHGPNSHRFIAGIIVALGIVNIQAVLIAGCIIGIIAIAAALWTFINRCQTPLVACAILLFIVIDYSTFDQLLNPYRTWHYSLFFFVLASIIVGNDNKRWHYFVPGMASFLLFQYEYIFALFLSLACAFVILAGRDSFAHKRRVLLAFGLGAAISILLSLGQYVAYLGSVHALSAEAFNTWQERNTVLYAGRPTFDSHLITTSDLIRMFSVGEVAQRFYVPSGFAEYLRYTLAAFYAYYKFPIAILCAGLMLIGTGIACSRRLGVTSSLVDRRSLVAYWFHQPISRMALGCVIGVLVIGLAAPGYIAYIYFMLRLPMINLTVFLIMISLIILITELTKDFVDAIGNRRADKGLLLLVRNYLVAFVASIAVFAGAIVLLNTNSGWLTYGSISTANYGDEEFYLLEKHAVRGKPIATNAAWPITGVIHGITGRRPLQVESAESISTSASKPVELFLCRASEVKCNISKYPGEYKVLGADAKFILVKFIASSPFEESSRN
jgi:hypothetical protein